MEKGCACEDAVDAPGRAALQGPLEDEADVPDSRLGAWQADDWGPCEHAQPSPTAAKDACHRTRFVSCVDAVGRTVGADECSEGTQPRSVRPCGCFQLRRQLVDLLPQG